MKFIGVFGERHIAGVAEESKIAQNFQIKIVGQSLFSL